MQKQTTLKKRHGLTDINSYSSHALSFLQGAGPPLEYLAIVALRTAAGVPPVLDSVLEKLGSVEAQEKPQEVGHNQWMGFPI